MRMFQCFAATVIAAVIGPASAATYHLTIVHDNKHPTMALEVAPAGTGRWQSLARPDQLRGGRITQGSAILPDGECLADLRLTYANQPPITVSRWDLCRHPTLRLAQMRRKALETSEEHPAPSIHSTLQRAPVPPHSAGQRGL